MMNTVSIDAVVSRWNDPATRPLFKGRLIDMPPPDSDEPPCMCAQGDILHTFCGWDFERLQNAQQRDADTAIMAALGISRVHAVLLRQVNDKADGAPSIVLTNPELVLGDQAPRILKFWRYLDALTAGQLAAARNAAGAAARIAASNAAGAVAGAAAKAAARVAAWVAARAAARDAAWATNEIQGSALLTKFHFLPAFGFATPADLDALP